jgi:F0F1-type ATP synthase assembly protein I
MTGGRPSRPGLPGNDEADRRAGGSAARYAGIGLQFAGSILLFLYLGQWLDSRFGTAPWLLLLGVLVGAGGGFYSIYRRLMADLKREEAAKRKAPRPPSAPSGGHGP